MTLFATGIPERHQATSARGFAEKSAKRRKLGIFDLMESLGMKCPYPCMCTRHIPGKKGKPHHKDTCPRQKWAAAAQSAHDRLPVSCEPLSQLSAACAILKSAVPTPTEGDVLLPQPPGVSFAAVYRAGRWASQQRGPRVIRGAGICEVLGTLLADRAL